MHGIDTFMTQPRGSPLAGSLAMLADTDDKSADDFLAPGLHERCIAAVRAGDQSRVSCNSILGAHINEHGCMFGADGPSQSLD